MYDGFNIEGLDKIVEMFEVYGKNTDEAIKEGVKKGVRIVLKKAKQLCPVGPTGHLKKSLRGKVLRQKYKGTCLGIVKVLHGIAPHAHLVEYGHGGPSPAPPHPFLRPAFDETKDEVNNVIMKTFSDFIDERPFKDLGDITDILLE